MLPPRIIVPLTVGCALFMQNVDTTSLSTALPAVAADLGQPVVRLHLAITGYMLALAVFVPVSGWIADRWGAKNVFRAAVALFTLASIACGLATSFEFLVVARVIQGLGGAMMIPVARLILMRSVEKSELVGALAMMTVPAMFGPAVGPVLGGFLTTYASWRWVFWINIPMGILCIILVTRYINDTQIDRRRFDFKGFVLSGLGLGGLFLGFDTGGSQVASPAVALSSFAVGFVCLALYIRHARTATYPVIDLALLKIQTFRANVYPGTLMRFTIGALPFLLPLLLQEVFGYTAFQAGLVTIATAAGSLGMRLLTVRFVKRFGFRSVIMWSAGVSSIFTAACALFQPSTPLWIILLILFLGGVTRTVGFLAINALGLADVEPKDLSQATSFSATVQRLSQSIGVALAAFLLHLGQGSAPTIPLFAFQLSFVVMAVLSASSVVFFWRLPADAAAELTGRTKTPATKGD